MTNWQEIGTFVVGIVTIAAMLYATITRKGSFVRIGSRKNEPWWRREYILAAKTPNGLVHPKIDTNRSFSKRMLDLLLSLLGFFAVLAVGIVLIRVLWSVLIPTIAAIYQM